MKKSFITLSVTIGITLGLAGNAYAAGWEQHDSIWKYQNADLSYAQSEWQDINGHWYRFDREGNMLTGWQKIKKDWYYLDDTTGTMITGWFQDKDGKWYYLDDANGDMLTSKWTPDGYFVDKTGVYDASKGNKLSKKVIGPDAAVAAQKSANMLKGTTFPDLSQFATSNLSTELWGIEGSLESLMSLGDTIAQEVGNVSGANVFYVDGNSVTYAKDGIENPKLKLVKSGDHYELFDYGSIDKETETPLLAMCSLISSTPQSIYNAIYTVAEYDRTVMRSDYYKSFGDGQLMYNTGDGFAVFLIKAK